MGVGGVGEVDLGGELKDRVVWGECSGLLWCNCLLGFLGGDGAGMVVDIVGGKRSDIIVVEQCLVHFWLVW